MIALDTTALIDLFKGDKSLKLLMKDLNQGFATTSINCQEIYFGITPKEPKHLLEEEEYNRFFKEIIVFDFPISHDVLTCTYRFINISNSTSPCESVSYIYQ